MESTVLDPARKASKKCQIEGCHEITVGSRTALCRKHRNNKYKQNYNKKKKRKAHSPDEMPSESIENQLAEEKCLMEQKYASMLQQVLAQKRLELLQSENIIQVLQAHQQKVKQSKIKEIQERKLKKEQEAPENTDQGSVSSKITSDISSHSTKDRNSDKSNFKATKTAKKTQQQSKKGPAKSAVPKDMQIGNNHVTFSGNMGVTQKPLLPSSDLATKTLYAGVSITPSVWTNSDSYIGQNLLVPKGPAQQATPMRPLAMSTQPIPKTDSVFSYQQSTLSGVGQAGGYAKICIESVKDLSLGPSGKIATSVVTSAAPNSKALHNVQTRLPQNVQPYQMIQKRILPSENITSQGECNRQSFQSLTTSCTSAPVTTGGNIVTTMAVGQQSQISLPLLNFSQAMSLSNGQITTSGTYTQVSQTNQGTMSQNWPNQMIPGTGTGRLQAPGIQDDFLLQMLQDSKNSQLELVPQSQTNNTMTSLDHVLTDQTWTLSVGM